MLQTYYRSRLTFTASDGGPVSFEHTHGTTDPHLSAGDKLAVRYDARSPSESVEVRSIWNEIQIWTLVVVPALMGFAFLAAGWKVITR
jgi:hypothetical protein